MGSEAVQRIYRPLILVQDREVGGLASNSIYHVLTSIRENEWAIPAKRRLQEGFVEVHHDVTCGRGSVTYHHFDSQSTVKVDDGEMGCKPYVKIFGGNREKARMGLAALLATKGFALREPAPEEAKWMH